MNHTDTWLVWLHHDLRLDDNPLWQAVIDGAPTSLIVVHVLPETTFLAPFSVPVDSKIPQPLSLGRQRFLLESLEHLQQDLKALGSDLWVTHGQADRRLPEIIRAHHCSRVITRQAVNGMECTVQNSVEAALPNGCTLERVETGQLLTAAELPFAQSALPTSFSAFRREIERTPQLAERMAAPLPAPTSLPPWSSVAPRGFDDSAQPLCEAHGWQTDSRSDYHYLGGEQAAHEHLHRYLNQIRTGRNETTRNALAGADFSTRLSPWLALGSLSPRRVMADLITTQASVITPQTSPHETSQASHDWVRVELLWREYFQWHARLMSPAPSDATVTEAEPPQHAWVLSSADTFAHWCQGTTGVPWIDAGMQELAATGWLSNRLRQHVASFLVRDLKVDWRLGAAWFAYHLLDHDTAVNDGNWRHLAGIGCDSRDDRHFNMMKQAGQHDPQGTHVIRWLPALASLPPGMQRHAPWLSMMKAPVEGYPAQPCVHPEAWSAYLSGITPRVVRPLRPGSFEC